MKVADMLFYNRIFSRNTLNSFIAGDFPHPCAVAVKRIQIDTEKKSNAKVLSEIYRYMSLKYRNEYIYKKTLLNTLLLKNEKHNFETTAALAELPIGKSKADFVLINGKAEIYEIKTELDNFEKLQMQIIDYYKAFDHVNVVVASREKADELKKLLDNDNIGIYFLNKKLELIICRESREFNNLLENKIIFKIMRKQEYEHILVTYYGKLPEVSQFDYYGECCKLFCDIKLDEIYGLFLDQLKKRCKITKTEFRLLPESIKPLAYFINISRSDAKKLSVFMKNKYENKSRREM
jgi:hypothetical protein